MPSTLSRDLRRIFLHCVVLHALNVVSLAEEIRLERDGQEITASRQIAKDVYKLADAADDGVVIVRGQKLTIDFQGATLDGSADSDAPDQFHGRGIVLEDAHDVTIRNLTLRGFKIGLYAKNCRNLTIDNCDFSDNWKQHLLSTPQAENGADWLFAHENDANEWFRYGAGVYLDGCEGFTLRNIVCHRGQNGICLVRSQRGFVYDCDCSFNSGWGLALYRSSHNTIDHNKFDWCIRGYSHGVYNRGQDSAGILVFEQCSHNVFAFNSATHGGDGFFLFAGLETLDESGEGGCNNNLIQGNDFSHASNNGIEATFSTGNRFIDNTMDEADHAIWAGYSYGNEFVGNRITRCNHGISIEHGSENYIMGNSFTKVGIAVNLWAGENSSFADKPYGKHHHCRSEKSTLKGNRFDDNQIDIRLGRTSKVEISGNDLHGSKVALEVSGPAEKIKLAGNNIDGEIRRGPVVGVDLGENFYRGPKPDQATAAKQRFELAGLKTRSLPPDLRGKQSPFLAQGTLRGLKYILVDDWGPYDFQRIKVVPENAVFWNDAELRVLGPDSSFEIQNITGGVEVAPSKGQLPATLLVSSPNRKMRAFSFDIVLPERKETVTARGLLLIADWNVKFYGWKRVGPGKPPADWGEVIAGPVLEERRLSKIDFPWGGAAPSDKVPAEHFATVATTEIELPAGRYEVRTVSDDGIRVTIDGRRVIDNWTWHGPTEDKAEVDLPAGEHAIRIDHFEIDGAAQLQFWISPARQKSP